MRPSLAVSAALCLLSATQQGAAGAQTVEGDSASARLADARANRSISRRTYVGIGGATLAGSTLLSFSDRHVIHEVQKLRDRNDETLTNASVFASSLGGTGPISVSLALWGVGNLAHKPFTAQLGEEATHAVLLSTSLSILIKGLVGRSRPSASSDPDPDNYQFGRGFLASQRASFPSGHTTASFALATVFSRELSERYPRRRYLISSLFYGAASAVALSRVYQRAHWPSDVLTGAALGSLTGLRIVSTHNPPGSTPSR